MANDESRRDQAVRGFVNSDKLLNGTEASHRSAMAAAARRAGEENRVPPLTDFTADAHSHPLLTQKNDVSPAQHKSAVEAAGPVDKYIEDQLGKKP